MTISPTKSMPGVAFLGIMNDPINGASVTLKSTGLSDVESIRTRWCVAFWTGSGAEALMKRFLSSPPLADLNCHARIVEGRVGLAAIVDRADERNVSWCCSRFDVSVARMCLWEKMEPWGAAVYKSQTLDCSFSEESKNENERDGPLHIYSHLPPWDRCYTNLRIRPSPHSIDAALTSAEDTRKESSQHTDLTAVSVMSFRGR